MKNFKKAKVGFLLSLILVLSIILSACGSTSTSSKASSGGSGSSSSSSSSSSNSNSSSNSSKKPITIGFSVYGLKAEFANLLKNAMEQEAKKKGVTLKVLDGNYKADTAIQQLQNLQVQGVNAIIVDPIDANALNNTVDSIVTSGIPVIGVNAKMTAKKLTSYVGSPDVKAGQMEAEQMAKALNDKGNIVVLDGPIGQSAQIERKKGILEVMKKYPNIKILDEKTANWSRSEALNLMENWLQKYGNKINGVIGENDEMALGAEKALQEKGMNNVPVVGIDGVKDALNAVKNGQQIASIYQNAQAQGVKSLDIAIQAAEGKTVQKNYDIPFELVTKSNVDKYLNK